MKRIISFILSATLLFLSTAVMVAALFESSQNEADSKTSAVIAEKLALTDVLEPIQAPEDENIIIESRPLLSDECMILEHVDADAFKEAGHISRLTNQEQLNTYVFLNRDGTRSVYYMDENIKFIDKNGEVKEKDISLVESSNGFGIVQNDVDLLLPNDPDNGIDITYGDYTVKITPQASSNAAFARKDIDSVVYDGYFGENTSLKYTPMLSGIKEDVIMYKYIENATFEFLLETDGLYLCNNTEGYYLAESILGEKVFDLGEVLVYDAVGRHEYGTMSVNTLEEGQKYSLTLSVSEEYLTDPTTVYPVTIDPTLTVSEAATGTDAIEDVPLFSGRSMVNHGDFVYLSIGYVDSTYKVGQVAVKLPGLYNSTEYNAISASNISSVKFYCWDTSGNSTQFINLYRITGPSWNENETYWARAHIYKTDINWGANMANASWTSFDITTLVRGWKNGDYSSELGFMLVNNNTMSASYKKAPYSSEYSNTAYRPYVVMTYSNGTAPISEGTYYLNSWGTSKYLNNFSGAINGVSATNSDAQNPRVWEFIHYTSNTYLIKPVLSSNQYLSAGTTLTSTGVLLQTMDVIESRFLWTVTPNTSGTKLIIQNCYGKYLCSNLVSENIAYASISVKDQQAFAYEWRYVKTSEFVELSTFSANIDSVECFENKQYRVVADPYTNSFVEPTDFKYEIFSGRSYLTLSKSGSFAKIRGTNVGDAVIKITYKVSNLTKNITVNVLPYSFAIGFSTENYDGGCSYGTRKSYTYASTFYQNVESNNANHQLHFMWLYNKDDVYSDITGASKEDFGKIGDLVGEISNQVDLMVYIGHGIAADRTTAPENGNDRSKGNFLHYNYDSSGNSHGWLVNCTGDQYNLYTSEARFANPRWVWLYTCNFLNTNAYVNDMELKQMMNGTHILLGYSTTCNLVNTVPVQFACELSDGETIINAFFNAGDDAEDEATNDDNIQKVLYVPEAIDETIYSEPIAYDYSPEDILILHNNISDDQNWS